VGRSAPTGRSARTAARSAAIESPRIWILDSAVKTQTSSWRWTTGTPRIGGRRWHRSYAESPVMPGVLINSMGQAQVSEPVHGPYTASTQPPRS
jgi:hypothetical protein